MTRYRINKKKRAGLIIAIFVIIVIVIIAVMVVKNIMGADGYHSEGSFEKYTNNYYDQIGGKQQTGTSTDNLKYGEPLSTAIEFPKMNDDTINTTITNQVSTDKKSFDIEYDNLTTTDKGALLIGFESYNTPEKVVSVAIHEKIRIKKSDKVTTPKDTVTTYNFATKTGTAISTSQIFKGAWLSAVSKKVTKAVEKDYGDNLKSDYAAKLSASADNFSKFIMTDKGLKFYFDSGTIADAKEGVISEELSYDNMSDYMQDNIGNRVIDPNKPMVAITYDDGPSATTTPELLDIYEKNKAVCTFFELGKNVASINGASDILKRELELGCEIGTHSWNHPNLQTLSDSQIKNQADKAKEAIRNATGQDPTVFRPPYGNGSAKIAKIFNLPTINWSVDTLDWSSKNASAIVSQVKRIDNLDGQIVLMHSIYEPSVQASKEIVPWLQKQGYQLVTVSELLQYKCNQNPPVNGKWYGYKFLELESHN